MKVNKNLFFLLVIASIAMLQSCSKAEITIDELGLSGTTWVNTTVKTDAKTESEISFNAENVKISIATAQKLETPDTYMWSNYNRETIYHSYSENGIKKATIDNETFIIDDDDTMTSQTYDKVYTKK